MQNPDFVAQPLRLWDRNETKVIKYLSNIMKNTIKQNISEKFSAFINNTKLNDMKVNDIPIQPKCPVTHAQLNSLKILDALAK